MEYIIQYHFIMESMFKVFIYHHTVSSSYLPISYISYIIQYHFTMESLFKLFSVSVSASQANPIQPGKLQL